MGLFIAVGLIGTPMFMVLSSVAVAAFAYVTSHPSEIVIAVVGGIAIVMLFRSAETARRGERATAARERSAACPIV